MEKLLRVKFGLYSWADEEISSLAAYYRLLRSFCGLRAQDAFDELVYEIDQTNYEKILEL